MNPDDTLALPREARDRVQLRLEALLRQRATLETQVRTQGEQQQSERERLFLELLEVVDLLDQLATGLDNVGEGAPPMVSRASRAVRAASGKLLQSLTTRGVETLPEPEATVDFSMHRVMATEHRPELPEQTPLTVLKKGYRLDDRILRPVDIITSRQS